MLNSSHLLEEVIPKENLIFSFNIVGFSRAVLQQVARHRAFSLSVQSTRYTLKKRLKQETKIDFNNADKYIVLTKNDAIDKANIEQLNRLIEIMKSPISNDVLKYAIPESFKTEFVLTTDYKGLDNFLKLRGSKDAMEEIRILAKMIYESLSQTDKKYFNFES
jgi:thymidylate synthase (FAD)